VAVVIELNEKLAELAGGERSVTVEAETVQDAVVALAKLHRPVGARIFNCEGALRDVVRTTVNGEPVRPAIAAQSVLKDGDVVALAFP